jgi:long-chain acyl-CoA synthetase
VSSVTQSRRIVPIIGNAPAVVADVMKVRAAGEIPLVGDPRWPRKQWDAIRHAAMSSAPPPDSAWATSTSGSSGQPRIVMRSDESWSASFPVLDALMETTPGDVLYLPSPPASSLSLFSIAHSMRSGLVLALPSSNAVTASDFREASHFHGTPHALRRVLEAIQSGAPSRLRMALVGGSDADPALLEQADRLGIRVVSYYGAAELSFVAVDRGDGLEPFPGAQIEIREGELWVRSPYVAAGYLTGDGPFRTDQSGWCTVGDLAELREGRISIHGRSDERILTASATVIPAEVETALRAITGVGDCVVFGLPVPEIGALVAAAIEHDSTLPRVDVAAIRRSAGAILAHTHVPRRWYVLQSFPRTSSGKPARAEIVQRVLAEPGAPS